jgi:hypothetical protein
MLSTTIRTLIHRQWAGLIALFLVLGGGVASATHPGGANTISSGDIINDEVRTQDIAPGHVTSQDIGTGEVLSEDIGNSQVALNDLAANSVNSGKLVNGGVQGADVLDNELTGADVNDNSLKGADIDEGTLDIGDAARAYALVRPATCAGTTPGDCTPEQSKGISSVTRFATGSYCVTAPGIDAAVTPAAVTVDWNGTDNPEGNASAMTYEAGGCSGGGFLVFTERQPTVFVDQGGGTSTATVSGPAEPANDVAFTIVIP